MVRFRLGLGFNLPFLCCANDAFQWIKSTILLFYVIVMVRVRASSGHNTLQASRLTSLK